MSSNLAKPEMIFATCANQVPPNSFLFFFIVFWHPIRTSAMALGVDVCMCKFVWMCMWMSVYVLILSRMTRILKKKKKTCQASRDPLFRTLTNCPFLRSRNTRVSNQVRNPFSAPKPEFWTHLKPQFGTQLTIHLEPNWEANLDPNFGTYCWALHRTNDIWCLESVLGANSTLFPI